MRMRKKREEVAMAESAEERAARLEKERMRKRKR